MSGPSNVPPRPRVPVILVRHGVTSWNRDGLVQGWTDIDLTPLGRRQAERVGAALVREPIGRIITSDLSRARETAAIIAAARGSTADVYEELREYCCGEWEGRPYEDIRASDRDRFWAWFNDPETAMPGGESMGQAMRRAAPVIDRVIADMAEAGTGDALLIVGHGGINRLIAAHLLDLELSSARRLRLDNGSISRFEPFLKGWGLRLWNGTHHLDDLPADEGDAP